MNAPAQMISYRTLARGIVDLKPLVGEARWEEAAGHMQSLAARLESLPAADVVDRDVIENALSDLAGLIEQVQPLHADIARLLFAFGPGTVQAAVQ